MPDELPTIWEGTAHTFAKHQILQAYLNAWMPIMSKQSHRRGASPKHLLFVDGFAGPGSYTGGQEGSPILALKSVLDHSHDFQVPVSFLFIEQDQERYIALTNTINQHKRRAESSPRIKSITTIQDDCATVLNSYLDDLDKTQEKLGPAFFFLDQFGYSDIPMPLIQRIMNHPQCEVFSYLNWARMNQFLTDKTKWPSITNAFGGNEWTPVIELLPTQKPAFILTSYRHALKTRASAKYVWHFPMCDKHDKLIYWLFFCTNSLRGLEEMKRAMWKVDPTGGFRFSDKDDPSQLHLFKNYTDEILTQELLSHFQCRQPTLHQVKEFVLTETPAYLYKNTLKLLEQKQLLRVPNPPPRRRRGTFPHHDMRLEFLDYSAE